MKPNKAVKLVIHNDCMNTDGKTLRFAPYFAAGYAGVIVRFNTVILGFTKSERLELLTYTLRMLQ